MLSGILSLRNTDSLANYFCTQYSKNPNDAPRPEKLMFLCPGIILSQFLLWRNDVFLLLNNHNLFKAAEMEETALASPHALRLFFPSRSGCTNGQTYNRIYEILLPEYNPYVHETQRCFW